MKRIRYRISPKKYLPECLQYKIDRRAMLDYDHNIERHFFPPEPLLKKWAWVGKYRWNDDGSESDSELCRILSAKISEFKFWGLWGLWGLDKRRWFARFVPPAAREWRESQSSSWWLEPRPGGHLYYVYITYITCITYISNALMPWWHTSSWAMPRSFSYWTLWRCCPACYFSTYWPSPASSQPTTWPRCFC